MLAVTKWNLRVKQAVGDFIHVIVIVCHTESFGV